VQGFPGIFIGEQMAIDRFPGAVISQSFAVTEQSFHSAADPQVARFDSIYQQGCQQSRDGVGVERRLGNRERGQAGQDLSISYRQLAVVRSVGHLCWRNVASVRLDMESRVAGGSELYKHPRVANRGGLE